MTQIHATTRPRSLDWGRMIMVPLCILLSTTALMRLDLLLQTQGWIKLSTMVLTLGFNALIIWAYFRRGPATKTARSVGAVAAALAGTFSPLALPFLGSGAPALQVAAGEVVLAMGLLFSVWSIQVLDRSFSIFPQARVLVSKGPYSHIRHPLYLGEIVATLGVAIALGGWAPMIGWAFIVALQMYRSVEEEKLLSEALPDYREYQRQTARIIPGWF